MVRTSLTRPLWWTAARMGLCLASVGDSELQRLRLIVLWAGGGAALVVLANGLAAAPPPPSGSAAPVHALSLGPYAVAVVLALISGAIWLYSRIIVRRA